MKVTLWKAKCEFCDKEFIGGDKDKLEKQREAHMNECEGIKKLHELYKIPLEDRLILFKILDEGEEVETVRKFLKKNKLSIERLRTILDELESEAQCVKPA